MKTRKVGIGRNSPVSVKFQTGTVVHSAEAQIAVPDYRVLRSECEIIARKWAPAGVEKVRSNLFLSSTLLSQLSIDFDVPEIAKAVKTLTGLHKPKFLVFAGFNGKFALALKKAGFNVLFTDANCGWVKRAKKAGLTARKACSAFLETDGFDVWITYEGNEALSGAVGFLTMMRGLAHSRGFLIYVKSKAGTDPYTPLPEIKTMASTYGLSVKTIYTNTLTFYCLQASSSERAVITKDLSLIDALNRKKMRRGSVPFDQAKRINKLFGSQNWSKVGL